MGVTTGGEETGDAQTSSLGMGKVAKEQGGMSTWWAAMGYLAYPCVALASILPQEVLTPSEGNRDSLETWWK